MYKLASIMKQIFCFANIQLFVFLYLSIASRSLSFISQQKFSSKIFVLYHNTFFSTSSLVSPSLKTAKSEDSSLESSSNVKFVTRWR